jgi:hypothetical protein
MPFSPVKQTARSRMKCQGQAANKKKHRLFMYPTFHHGGGYLRDLGVIGLDCFFFSPAMEKATRL